MGRNRGALCLQMMRLPLLRNLALRPRPVETKTITTVDTYARMYRIIEGWNGAGAKYAFKVEIGRNDYLYYFSEHGVEWFRFRDEHQSILRRMLRWRFERATVSSPQRDGVKMEDIGQLKIKVVLLDFQYARLCIIHENRAGVVKYLVFESDTSNFMTHAIWNELNAIDEEDQLNTLLATLFVASG